MNASIPILEFDTDRTAMLDPSKIIARNENMPERCVICFFNDIINQMLTEGLIVEIACLRSEIGKHPVFILKNTDPSVALFHPGIGAPLAAGFLEELVALGANKFIACGGAGALDSAHELEKLIVPTSAVRDEGTSYHYLPPSEEVEPTALALQAIKQALSSAGVMYEHTKTWTTDAVYRETRGKIERRKKSGCGCVEMEAAALFAVARYRGVELAQILYAGDDLSGEFWDSREWNDQWGIRAKLLQLAIKACSLMQ